MKFCLQSDSGFIYNQRMEIIDQRKAVEKTESASAIDDTNARLVNVLQLIKSKNESALAQFYDLTSKYVYGLAVKMCMDPGMAEEVTSDVYTHVWQHAVNYDASRAKVLTWVLMLCRSRAIDALRREAKHDVNSDESSGEETAALQEPPDILQALEQQSSIYQAIQQLNSEQRQLLSLAFFRGYSHQQIADCTSLPLGTVKTHIRNAVKKIKDKLQNSTKNTKG